MVPALMPVATHLAWEGVEFTVMLDAVICEDVTEVVIVDVIILDV